MLVRQHAQTAEQLRHMLHLIDHDEATRVSQREHRIGKPGAVSIALEIEEVRGTTSRLNHLTRKRGLPDLTWPNERYHRKITQERGESSPVVRAINLCRHTEL